MLLAVSVLTTLTTQAIKAVKGTLTAPNLTAAITSCILSIAISAGHIVYREIPITPQIIIEVIALVYFSFLGATVGYDKVMQAIKQIVKGKVDNLAMDGDK